MSESKTSKKVPVAAPKKPLGAAAPTSPPADPKPAPKVEAKPAVVAAPKPAEPKPELATKPAAKKVEAKAPAAKPASTPKAAPAKAVAETKSASTLPEQSVIDKMVAEAAYYLAEKRNFASGFEEEDWLKAREQIMSQLLAAKKPKKSTK